MFMSETKSNEIKETGTLQLENRKGHHIQLLTIIGEIEDMKQCRAIQKQPNMSIFFLN